MLIKYNSAKIIKTASTLSGLAKSWQGGLVKRAAKSMAALDLDQEKYVYLRNRSVSALELWGANQNSDAFEYDELSKKYSTFIGKPVTVDHIGTDVIGTVIDSEFIPAHSFRDDLGIPMLPYENTREVLSGMLKQGAMEPARIYDFANKNNLVRSSDEKLMVDAVSRFISLGGWVENILAIERKAADEHTPGFVKAVLNGDVHDTSMGCAVEHAVCSVCQNIATGELPEHEDFCDCIRMYKGRPYTYEGVEVIPFEINRDIDFFEDTIILPFALGGKAGGEGADMQAKLLEVFAAKRKTASLKKAYIETNPNPQTNIRKSPDAYVLIGDAPEIVEKNKNEFKAEKDEIIQQHIEEQSAPGNHPEGTILTIKYEDEEVDAVVVEEFDEEGTLIVAIDGIDKPIEITADEVIEVKEYPDEMSYEAEESADNLYEMHPENRAASFTKKSILKPLKEFQNG